MEIIDNINKTLRDDLKVEIKDKSKLSIAAACFSIYAFQELKEELKNIEELRFIFTSPTFVTEKTKKEKPAQNKNRTPQKGNPVFMVDTLGLEPRTSCV